MQSKYKCKPSSKFKVKIRQQTQCNAGKLLPKVLNMFQNPAKKLLYKNKSRFLCFYVVFFCMMLSTCMYFAMYIRFD